MIYNFYHITDVHYYSKRNFKCDWKNFPQPSTQICILKSEEALYFNGIFHFTVSVHGITVFDIGQQYKYKWIRCEKVT